MEAGQFVKTIEKRQGLKVACLEEIGYQNGWISKDFIIKQANSMIKTSYGKYLMRVASDHK